MDEEYSPLQIERILVTLSVFEVGDIDQTYPLKRQCLKESFHQIVLDHNRCRDRDWVARG
jgi:hypothetical protein